MKRLGTENYNTKEYYNKALLRRFDESGLDYSDTWRIDKLLDKYTGGKLLDVGCGVCPLVNTAKEKYDSEIWGIDFADKLIEALKVKYPKINYAVSDFNNLFFKDNYFDYVVMGEVIEHSENPERVIKEALRVLKPGGILSVSAPLNERQGIERNHIWSFQEEDIRNLIPNIFEGELRTFYRNCLKNTFICKALK